MIQEAYVSFEVAKLLKEKGFCGPCRATYSPKGIVRHYLKEEVYGHHLKGHKKLCPTHQMAMKWLRGKGIECVVIPIWNTIGKQYRSYVLSDLGDKYKDNYDSYSDNISYEGAVEAALKYTLENLI